MKYPCKECIVKGNCSKMCDDLIEEGINIRIVRYRCCPDCGHTEGLIFNKGYAGIIECCGCYSSFFPMASSSALVNIIRYRKGIRVSSNVSTSFGKFIDLADNFKDALIKLREYEDFI